MIDIFLTENNIPYEVNVSLKKKTWIHRGGMANFFITPMTIDQLTILCSFLYKNSMAFDLIGHTSNLYFLNDYNPNIVITTRLCNHVTEKNGILICDCGVSVSRLARKCVNSGICGFEYLTELPGTVGAAVYNNSSCKTNSIASIVEYIDFLTDDGKVVSLTPEHLDFSFRSSSLKKNKLKGLILRVYLRAEQGDSSKLVSIAEKNRINRNKFFRGHSRNLGCTFDNPSLSWFYRVLLKLVWCFCKALGKDENEIDYVKKYIL
ncbi:MAG: FAD-binding protein, partial [Bacteroidales bacterium]